MAVEKLLKQLRQDLKVHLKLLPFFKIVQPDAGSAAFHTGIIAVTAGAQSSTLELSNRPSQA